MGSYEILRSNDQVHDSSPNSSLCSETQRSCSKAQNCLLKILRIISTTPPQHNNTSPFPLENDVKKGLAIDLNVGFSVPVPEMEESASPVDGGLFAAEGDGECEIEGNKNKEVNEIGEMKEQQGFMNLLIEAATLIFGDFKDEVSVTSLKSETCNREKTAMDDELNGKIGGDQKQVKRKLEEGKTSSCAVVRSKRGRLQVLPNKYRDSILEPLTPFTRIRSTIFANRRRSK